MREPLGILSVAAVLLAGCAEGGAMFGSLDFGNPFSRASQTEESVPQSETASPTDADIERAVTMIDGIAVPQQKPEPIPPAGSDASASPAHETEADKGDTKHKALAEASDAAAPTDLAEPRYALNGPVTPARKPPPPPPSVAEIAAKYRAFRQDLEAISQMPINTPKNVAIAEKRLEAHDPQMLAEGWVAYTAEMTANDPAFKQALTKRLEKSSRRNLLTRMEEKPGYVASLSAFKKVKPNIVSLISSELSLMKSLGASFHEQSLIFQRTRWGQAAPEGRSRPTLASAGQPVSPASSDLGLSPADPILGRSSLWLASSTARTARAHTPTLIGHPKASMGPMMGRILDLAARISVDATEGAYRPASQRLMANKGMARCLNWARLNLAQCTAAAAKPSELAYCTAKHALEERANCWDWLISFDQGA